MSRTLFAAVVLAAGIALTGCSSGPDEVNSGMIGSATPTTVAAAPTTAQATTPPGTAAPGAPRPAAPRPGAPARCTDRINYAGDPRPNAEINSIGERTGRCPPVQRPTTPSRPPGVPYDPDKRCTDQINYVGDPRSNAEINLIGERTGTCPAPRR